MLAEGRDRRNAGRRRWAWLLGAVAGLGLAGALAVPPVVLHWDRSAAQTGTRAAMPFDTVALKATDGTVLTAWWVPSIDTLAVLVLVPGEGGAQATAATAALADDLSGRGYGVLVLDVRGQGGSGPATALAAQEGADVRAAVDYIAQALPGARVGAVGFGLGGLAVLDAAATDARIQTLVAVQPPLDPMQPVDALFRRRGWPGLAALPARLVWGFGTIMAPADALARLDRRPAMIALAAGDETAQAQGRALAARAAAGLFLALPPADAAADSGWDAPYRANRAALVERIGDFLDDTFATRFGLLELRRSMPPGPTAGG